MKRILTLTFCVIMGFTTFILAQEKKAEKPKETEKSKEVEKLIEVTKGNLSDVFKKSNDPHGYIVSHRNRGKSPVFYNPFPDVTDIELGFDDIEKDTLSSELCFPDKIPGEIITKSTNPNNNALTYHYAVTGGKIIGQGEKVIWNLSGVKAGTYTITAAVDDGCGFCGKTVTKTITIKDCPDCK